MSYELKDYLNSINFTKKDLMKSEDKEWIKKYPAFIINKILSGFSDTIMLVNEVNRNHFLDKDMQYSFLLNSIRSKKRFSPFLRANKLKDIDLVKEYYGYSNEKARMVHNLLTDNQITELRKKVFKGGRK